MRAILPILALLLVSSCVTEKKRAKICATCPTKDSVSVVRKDSIIYRDTVLFITLAGDTVKVPSPCDSLGKLKIFEVKEKKNGLVTTIKSDGKTLTATCAADSLMKVVEKIRADYYASIHSGETSHIKLECERDHRNWLDKAGRWALLIDLLALVAMGAYLYFRLRKG